MSDTKFEVKMYAPGNEAHSVLDSQVGVNREAVEEATMFYNGVCAAYNDCPVGGIIVYNTKKRVQLSNLAKVLAYRGIERDADYTIIRLKHDEQGRRFPAGERPVRMKRLSKAVSRLI